MESVKGNCVATCEDSGEYLLFVVSEGEQGDSGTLLFTIGSNDVVVKHELVGLFQGVLTSRAKGMRTRGKITPIPPFNELVGLCPIPPKDINGDSIGLGTATSRMTYNIEAHPTYVTLKPKDELLGRELFGVIVCTKKERGVNSRSLGGYYGATSPGDGDWDGDGGEMLSFLST
jgi:hypothetical protein